MRTSEEHQQQNIQQDLASKGTGKGRGDTGYAT